MATRPPVPSGSKWGGNGTEKQQVKNRFQWSEEWGAPKCAEDIQTDFELTQPPNLIPNLRMWLKADAGVVELGGGVRTWLDQSVLTNDAQQLTSASRPFFQTNVFAGRPAIYFPGTNNYFNLTNALFTNMTEAEIFVVVKAETNEPSAPRGLWRLSPQTTYYPKTDGTISDSVGTGDLIETGDQSQPLDQPHIYNVLTKPGEWTSRINGVVHFSRNSNTPQFISSAVRLGLSDSANYFAGHIAEVLLYARALNANERFAVGAYLSQRYSLITNAPGAPTNLVAYAVATNQIAVLWSGSLSNIGSRVAVQRKTGNGSCGNVAVLENSLSFLDSGLASTSQYRYRVKVSNYSGQELVSAETNVTTLNSGAAIPLESLRLWLKADSGRGGSPDNCWMDQTTNGYHAIFKKGDLPKQSVWDEAGLNGNRAMFFGGSNGMRLLVFTTGWTQAEAFVVLNALGSTASNWSGLWLMGSGALASYYPYTNSTIWENFGRTNSPIITGASAIQLSTPHLYDVMSKSGSWKSWLNNGLHYSTIVNTVGFQETSQPRFGWGASPNYFNGYVSEVMIFDRELTDAERGSVATNYLRQRFNLW